VRLHALPLSQVTPHPLPEQSKPQPQPAGQGGQLSPLQFCRQQPLAPQESQPLEQEPRQLVAGMPRHCPPTQTFRQHTSSEGQVGSAGTPHTTVSVSVQVQTPQASQGVSGTSSREVQPPHALRPGSSQRVASVPLQTVFPQAPQAVPGAVPRGAQPPQALVGSA